MALTLRHSEDVDHGLGYAHRTEYQWEEQAFEGAVLDEGQESCRIMSDVWGTRYFATVWNAETGEPESVTLQIVDHGSYCSDPHTRAWWDWHHSCQVDATPEVEEAYLAYLNAEEERKTLQRFEANLSEALAAASEPTKGSYVELSRKRCKVPFGTRGHVFWTGDSHYGERVGFKGEDGETYWTAARNVTTVKGHENWGDTCQDCGGHGWLPANDGKGGHARCPACERRAAEWVANREREEAERQAAHEAELDNGGYVGRGARVEVVASEGNDAPVGSSGKVFWRGPNRYGPGERVGFNGPNGETFWAAVENVRHATKAAA